MYFIPHKAQIEIEKHFDRLLKYGILWPCQSSWNTSLITSPGTQKPGTEDFKQVQDLWVINSAIVMLHPIVPNQDALLGLVPPEAKFLYLPRS
jgi:hypothetical protein